MSQRHFLLALLSLGLMSCSGGGNPNPPNSALDDFYASQTAFTDALPPGTATTTPEEFKRLVDEGARVVTAADLKARAEAERLQRAQDDADADAFVSRFRQFKAMLNDDPAVNNDRLVTVETASGPKKVVLMGNAFARSSLAQHDRTYATRDNQARVYAELYADLNWALTQLDYSPSQFDLPRPENLSGYDTPALREFNARVAEVTQELLPQLLTLKRTLGPIQSEVGSADQMDRTQKGDCQTASNGGLLRNFDWPLKRHTTSVKDQGQRGTCWAFAVIGALEAEISARDGKQVNLSEQDYAAHRFLQWSPRAYGDGGDSIYVAQKASASAYVFPLERGWQYNKSLWRTQNDTTQTYMNSCLGYQDNVNKFGPCSDTTHQGYRLSVPYLNKKTGQSGVYLIDSLPKVGSPSSYRMQAPRDFWDSENPHRSMITLLLRSLLGHASTVTLDMRYVNLNSDGYARNRTMNLMPDGNPDWQLNHVMTVTGFISTDAIRKTLPNVAIDDELGYFVVKNSWGDCWGDQGYVYLPSKWIETFVGQSSTGIAPE